MKSRVDHCASQDKLEKLRAGSPYLSKMRFDKDHWLFPIEVKRDLNGRDVAGMLHGISMTGYQRLLDWSSRLVRPGKAHAAVDAAPLLERLKIEPAVWQATLEKLSQAKTVGNYFGSAQRLQEIAAQRGRQFVKNVTGRQFATATNAG